MVTATHLTSLLALLQVLWGAVDAVAPKEMGVIDSPEEGVTLLGGDAPVEEGAADLADRFDLQWTAAEGAGSMRFSKRFRDTAGEDYQRWAALDPSLLGRAKSLAGALAIRVLTPLAGLGMPLWAQRWVARLLLPPSLWLLPLLLLPPALLLWLVLRAAWRLLHWWLARKRSDAAAGALTAEVQAARAAAAAAAKQLQTAAAAAARAIETARAAKVGMVRFCRFCDVRVRDEFIEGHLAKKRHARNAEAALQVPGATGSLTDCWYYVEKDQCDEEEEQEQKELRQRQEEEEAARAMALARGKPRKRKDAGWENVKSNKPAKPTKAKPGTSKNAEQRRRKKAAAAAPVGLGRF